ncbi:MAG TPA: hypothetical protein VIY54_03685 [Steroidobacteraceae bacterium]
MKWLMVLTIAVFAVLAACGGSASKGGSADGANAAAPSGVAKPEARPAKEDSAPDAKTNALVLDADDVRTLGITTAPARSANYSPAPEGFGIVLSHELIAQVAADVQTAQAATRQSQAALARAQRLAGTPGALGAEVVETTTRQVAADRAAQSLAASKLTATLGLHFPSADGAIPSSTLSELAEGRVKLVRVSFPPGELAGAVPGQLRLLPLDGSGTTSPGVLTSEVWPAPQDSSIPGRSVFALVRGTNLEEGARMGVQAVSASSTAGTWIPASAVVISNGLTWCYVVTKPGTYLRTAIDTNRPLGDGYFVTNIASGVQVVTAAAGLLLARQLGSGAEED